mmetsp:Transcript_26656/g.89710  ORF Transcript_26656/g.89710 Transcript_26656/m.89710 type:complete len:225 (+) Transcript_26656:1268-1942(+)
MRHRLRRFAAAHHRRRGGLGPRPPRHRHLLVRHQGRFDDHDHALHGHCLYWVCRVDGRGFGVCVRRLQGVFQAVGKRRGHHAHLPIRSRRLRPVHGRAGRGALRAEAQPRLGLSLHGHRDWLGRDAALVFAHLEGRFCQRRRRCCVGWYGSGNGHVGLRRASHFGKGQHRVARHFGGHDVGQPRRSHLVGCDPLVSFETLPPKLRLEHDARHRTARRDHQRFNG